MYKQSGSAQQIENKPISEAMGEKLSNCFSEIIDNSMGKIVQEFESKIGFVKEESKRMVRFIWKKSGKYGGQTFLI